MTAESSPNTPNTPEKPPFQPSLQLPDGIENQIEAFAIKSLIGGTVGAATGLLLFRSGRGANAAAGAAFGIGCAAGSFVERLMADSDAAIPKFDAGFPDFSGWKKKD